MVLKIYLARHGQDEDNAAGILNGHRNEPLTKLGIEQAQTVANKIVQQGLKFNKIYSSPLQRAYDTAKIIASATSTTNNNNGGDDVEIMDLLIERDFGIMTGTPTKEIKERCSSNGYNVLETSTITYFLSPNGAETFPQLIQRGNIVIDQIQSIYKEQNQKQDDHDDYSILLVTHGDFGKMLYAAYYKLDWKDVLKQFHFGNSEVLLLSKDSSPNNNAHVFTIQQYNS